MNTPTALKVRGPKITARTTTEPCVLCARKVKRGVYSKTIRFWACADATACASRMKARRKAS